MGPTAREARGMSAPSRAELLAAALRAVVADNDTVEGALGTIRVAAGPAAEAVARSVLMDH